MLLLQLVQEDSRNPVLQNHGLELLMPSLGAIIVSNSKLSSVSGVNIVSYAPINLLCQWVKLPTRLESCYKAEVIFTLWCCHLQDSINHNINNCCLLSVTIETLPFLCQILLLSHDQTRAKRVLESFMINAYVHTTPKKYPSISHTQTLVPKSHKKI